MSAASLRKDGRPPLLRAGPESGAGLGWGHARRQPGEGGAPAAVAGGTRVRTATRRRARDGRAAELMLRRAVTVSVWRLPARRNRDHAVAVALFGLGVAEL